MVFMEAYPPPLPNLVEYLVSSVEHPTAHGKEGGRIDAKKFFRNGDDCSLLVS